MPFSIIILDVVAHLLFYIPFFFLHNEAHNKEKETQAGAG